jgi:hypothetical protein
MFSVTIFCSFINYVFENLILICNNLIITMSYFLTPIGNSFHYSFFIIFIISSILPSYLVFCSF